MTLLRCFAPSLRQCFIEPISKNTSLGRTQMRRRWCSVPIRVSDHLRQEVERIDETLTNLLPTEAYRSRQRAQERRLRSMFEPVSQTSERTFQQVARDR